VLACACAGAEKDGARVHAHCQQDPQPQPGRGDDDVEGSRAQATASYDSPCQANAAGREHSCARASPLDAGLGTLNQDPKPQKREDNSCACSGTGRK